MLFLEIYVRDSPTSRPQANPPQEKPQALWSQNRPPLANMVLKITTPSNILKKLTPKQNLTQPQANIIQVNP